MSIIGRFLKRFGTPKVKEVIVPKQTKTPEEILELENLALKELRERWGKDQVYRVQISEDEQGKLSIKVSCSEQLFLAWDDGEHWKEAVWGTAKSNLEDIFAFDSKFKNDAVVSTSYSRSDHKEFLETNGIFF